MASPQETHIASPPDLAKAAPPERAPFYTGPLPGDEAFPRRGNPCIFIIGITGYIGGTVARLVIETYPQHQYVALVRKDEDVPKVAAMFPQVRIVMGRLEDRDIIMEESAKAKIVLQMASADNEIGLRAIIDGIRQCEKNNHAYLIHTSSAAVLADPNIPLGDFDLAVYDDIRDFDYITSLPDTRLYRLTDAVVLEAPAGNTHDRRRVRTAIIAPATVYGPGTGPGNKRSFQIPTYARLVLKHKQAFTLGEGKNYWTHVHVDNLARAYLLLVEKALRYKEVQDGEWNDEYATTGYYFANDGEHCWGALAKTMGEKAFREGWIPTDQVEKLSLVEVVPLTFAREEPFWLGSNVRGHGSRLRRLGWQPPWKSFDEYAREEMSTEAAILKNEELKRVEMERITAEFGVHLRVESEDEVNLTGRPRIPNPVEAATSVGETRTMKIEEQLEEEMEMKLLAGAAALTVLSNDDREMGDVPMVETRRRSQRLIGNTDREMGDGPVVETRRRSQRLIGNTAVGNIGIGGATIGQRKIRKGRNKTQNTKARKITKRRRRTTGRRKKKTQNTKTQKDTTTATRKRKAQDITMEDGDVEDAEVEAQKSKGKKVLRWKERIEEVEAEIEGESSQMGSGGGGMEDVEMLAHGRIGGAPQGRRSEGQTKGKTLQSAQADSDEAAGISDLESETKSRTEWQRDIRGSISRLRARYREVMRQRAEEAEATDVEEADDERGYEGEADDEGGYEEEDEDEEEDEEAGDELGSGWHTKGRRANVRVLNYDQYADLRSAYSQVEDKETMSDVIANATPPVSSPPAEQVMSGLETLEELDDQARGDVVMQSIEPADETSPESDESDLDATARDRRRLEVQERVIEAQLGRELRFNNCKVVTVNDGEVVSDPETPEGSLESGEIKDGPGRVVLVNPGRGASMESGEVRDLPDGRKLVNPGRSMLAEVLGMEEVDEGTEGDAESEGEDDAEMEEEVEEVE